MNRPRRLAVLLMVMAVIVSAVYYTGAFSTLTTQRDASVEVAGDAEGYLGLAPADGPNGEYASQRDGQLRVSLSSALDEDASGSGVNPDAVTAVRGIFTITNQGTQPVGVWVTDKSDAVRFESESQSIEGKDGAVRLQPGDSIPVGLAVDTRQSDTDALSQAVTIHADTEVAETAEDRGTGGDDSQHSDSQS